METDTNTKECATCAHWDKMKMHKINKRLNVLGKAICNNAQSHRYNNETKATDECAAHSPEKTEETKIKRSRRYAKTQDKMNWII